MADKEELNWDDALTSGNFVKFATDETVILTVTNARLERNSPDAKFGAGEIAFKADVLEQDGDACEKTLEVNSNRLKKKLRPIFESVPLGAKTKLSILKVGDKFETQYSVKKLE